MATYDVTEIDSIQLSITTGDNSNGNIASLGDGENLAFAVFGGASSDTIAVDLNVDSSTHAVTEGNSWVSIDSDGNSGVATHFITSTGGSSYFLCIFEGAGGDGFARVFSINESTLAVTAHGTALEFDTADFDYGALVQLDSNTFLACWQGTSGFGYARRLSVNTSTWAVTALGFGNTTFDGTAASYIKAVLLTADASNAKVLIVWTDSAGDGKSRAYDVELSTSTISALGTADFEFDATDATQMSLQKIDTTHAFITWKGVSGDGFAQVLALDGSNNLSAVGTALEFDTSDANYTASAAIDSNHFLVTWTNGTDAKAQVLTVNPSTFAVTAEGTAATFTQEANFNVLHHSVAAVDSNGYFLNYHVEVDSSTFARDPYAVVLRVELPAAAATNSGFFSLM